MAVFTGTATNNVDLLNKIVGHLTDAGAMGAEVWQLMLSRTVAGNVTTQGSMEERYLKGPGLAGADAIHVNMRSYANVGSDYYNIEIRGAVAFNNLLPFETQPGTSVSIHKLLWQSATPYWLIANGRRFIIVAKVSTTYSNTYCGFYLPYATSAEMPYPMYIGSDSMVARRWSTGAYFAGSFFDPSSDTTGFPGNASAYLRHFDGSWQPVANYTDQSGSRSELDRIITWPYHKDNMICPNRDNAYPVIPIVINGDYSGGNTYGELQGAFYTSGFGNAAENTLTIAAKTYLITQNRGRTQRRDYCAVLLE